MVRYSSEFWEGEYTSKVPVWAVGLSKKSVVSNEHTSKFVQVDVVVSLRTLPSWPFILIVIWLFAIFVHPLTARGVETVELTCGELTVMPDSFIWSEPPVCGWVPKTSEFA